MLAYRGERGFLCRQVELGRVLRLVAQLLFIEGSIVLFWLATRRGERRSMGLQRVGLVARLIQCVRERGRFSRGGNRTEGVVTTCVAVVAGGAVVSMGAYDVARASAGCGGADGLEIGVRAVILLSSAQQAVFLWWLRAAEVRR